MTKQVINVGSAANDGTGDTLRVASTKINSNFTELYNTTGNGPQIFSTANAAFVKANTGTVLAQNAYNTANAANHLAQASFDYANTIISDTQVDPYARTNSNSAYLTANTASNTAQLAYARANTAISGNIDEFARATSNQALQIALTADTAANSALLTLAQLQTVVAESTDFQDFQIRVTAIIL